jgi:hypothetical protein
MYLHCTLYALPGKKGRVLLRGVELFLPVHSRLGINYKVESIHLSGEMGSYVELSHKEAH